MLNIHTKLFQRCHKKHEHKEWKAKVTSIETMVVISWLFILTLILMGLKIVTAPFVSAIDKLHNFNAYWILLHKLFVTDYLCTLELIHCCFVLSVFFSMVHHYYCIPPIYLPHKTFRFCLALFSFWKQFGNNFRAPTIYMFASVQSKKFQLNFLNFYTLLHIFSYVFLNSSRTFLWIIS